MQDDFSTPIRQSAKGIVVMAVDTLQKIVRALVIPLLVIIIKAKGAVVFFVFGGIIILVLVIAVFAYFQYRLFTFHIDELNGEFVINEGVFTKTNLTIQLDKIQQVNIRQSLLQRLIDVYSLQIDTAGSDKKEGDIKAIDKDLAESLKIRLLSHRPESISETVESADAQDSSKPFLKLSPLTLLKIGATSNYGQTIALIVAFLAAGFQGLQDIIKIFEVDQDAVSQNLRQGATFISISFLIISILVFILILNISRTFIRFFDFEVFRQKHSLIVNQGLFARKNTFLSAQRVQVTSYSQNYFQKKMGMLDMRMKQNAPNASSSDGQPPKSSDIEIPGCDKAERDKILNMIFDKTPEKGVELKPNFRYLFPGIFFWIILPLMVFFVVNAWVYTLTHPFILALIYVVLTGTMLYCGYRNHRLYVSENFIIKKQGIWDVDHVIIVPHKIQAITIKQMLWHRKTNIGHITCHTAAGNISFRFGDYTWSKKLMDYWLFQVESSAKDWM